MDRNWTETGAEYVQRLGKQEVEAEIKALDWQEIPVDGSLTVGFMPGHAINEAIRQLGLPRVTRVAISAFERPSDDPTEDGFYPGFYGVEASYKDGLARVYVLDVGTTLIPLASDFWSRRTSWGGEAAEIVKVTKGGTEVWQFNREAVA